MKTSNYARCGRNPNAVGISQGVPKWFQGRIYKKVAPPWSIIRWPESRYTPAYMEILSKLDPQQVYEALDENSILLCYEKPGEFCHRRLLAKWLEDSLGIEVPEFEPIVNTIKKPKIVEPPKPKIEVEEFKLFR
jgi:hypothetical protein